jgi:ssDNA-binding Zn-finger/Zn-ribbon topoisomerase 1
MKLNKQKIKNIIDKGCPQCQSKLLSYAGYRRFVCGECNSKWKLSHRNNKHIDPKDTSSWKAKCDECGGLMDYYNFKYCCRKCGHILEV